MSHYRDAHALAITRQKDMQRLIEASSPELALLTSGETHPPPDHGVSPQRVADPTTTPATDAAGTSNAAPDIDHKHVAGSSTTASTAATHAAPTGRLRTVTAGAVVSSTDSPIRARRGGTTSGVLAFAKEEVKPLIAGPPVPGLLTDQLQHAAVVPPSPSAAASASAAAAAAAAASSGLSGTGSYRRHRDVALTGGGRGRGALPIDPEPPITNLIRKPSPFHVSGPHYEPGSGVGKFRFSTHLFRCTVFLPPAVVSAAPHARAASFLELEVHEHCSALDLMRVVLKRWADEHGVAHAALPAHAHANTNAYAAGTSASSPPSPVGVALVGSVGSPPLVAATAPVPATATLAGGGVAGSAASASATPAHGTRSGADSHPSSSLASAATGSSVATADTPFAGTAAASVTPSHGTAIGSAEPEAITTRSIASSVGAAATPTSASASASASGAGVGDGAVIPALSSANALAMASASSESIAAAVAASAERFNSGRRRSTRGAGGAPPPLPPAHLRASDSDHSSVVAAAVTGIAAALDEKHTAATTAASTTPTMGPVPVPVSALPPVRLTDHAADETTTATTAAVGPSGAVAASSSAGSTGAVVSATPVPTDDSAVLASDAPAPGIAEAAAAAASTTVAPATFLDPTDATASPTADVEEDDFLSPAPLHVSPPQKISPPPPPAVTPPGSGTGSTGTRSRTRGRTPDSSISAPSGIATHPAVTITLAGPSDGSPIGGTLFVRPPSPALIQTAIPEGAAFTGAALDSETVLVPRAPSLPGSRRGSRTPSPTTAVLTPPGSNAGASGGAASDAAASDVIVIPSAPKLLGARRSSSSTQAASASSSPSNNAPGSNSGGGGGGRGSSTGASPSSSSPPTPVSVWDATRYVLCVAEDNGDIDADAPPLSDGSSVSKAGSEVFAMRLRHLTGPVPRASVPKSPMRGLSLIQMLPGGGFAPAPVRSTPPPSVSGGAGPGPAAQQGPERADGGGSVSAGTTPSANGGAGSLTITPSASPRVTGGSGGGSGAGGVVASSVSQNSTSTNSGGGSTKPRFSPMSIDRSHSGRRPRAGAGAASGSALPAQPPHLAGIDSVTSGVTHPLRGDHSLATSGTGGAGAGPEARHMPVAQQSEGGCWSAFLAVLCCRCCCAAASPAAAAGPASPTNGASASASLRGPHGTKPRTSSAVTAVDYAPAKFDSV